MSENKKVALKMMIDGKERDISFEELALSNNLSQEALVRLLIEKKVFEAKDLLDMMEKVKKGLDTPGPAYVEVFSVCPTGWRSPPDLSVRVGRLAVETGIFPLYEVENGQYKLSLDLPKLRPVTDYMKLQGRFRHLSTEEIYRIHTRVSEEYERLKEISVKTGVAK